MMSTTVWWILLSLLGFSIAFIRCFLWHRHKWVYLDNLGAGGRRECKCGLQGVCISNVAHCTIWVEVGTIYDSGGKPWINPNIALQEPWERLTKEEWQAYRALAEWKK